MGRPTRKRTVNHWRGRIEARSVRAHANCLSVTFSQRQGEAEENGAERNGDDGQERDERSKFETQMGLIFGLGLGRWIRHGVPSPSFVKV